ncbi:hypothetical protein TrRE_jg9674 [Triparma retinervis]|uniref:Rhodanese domain-containing protein n=1 Tax=Triparma retinervis TaxID=2557542 RepID=A0A9W7CF98_9STRA|nr:hypothetical protein TrRE_jg9674 [Triparma retinervis]
MGTILLAVEGVNVRLSGSLSAVEEFKIIIESVLSLPSSLVHYKDSTSSSPSLPRFLVKIKKELIGMGMPSADPSLAPSPAQHISPEDLHSMLTSSTSDVVLLDTRNDYELKMGTFKSAHHFDISTFRDFPASAKSSPLPKSDKIVMFCTGGIRCEKAAFAMEAAGYPSSSLYQLDGGILNYFEKVSPDASRETYEGGCFVFDDRVVVDVEGKTVKGVRVCFRCRWPLSGGEVEAMGGEDRVIKCEKCGEEDMLNCEGRKRKRNY